MRKWIHLNLKNLDFENMKMNLLFWLGLIAVGSRARNDSRGDKKASRSLSSQPYNSSQDQVSVTLLLYIL